MKIKWVCPVCSTTNVCEKTEHMQCFVCGQLYKEKLFISKRHILDSVDESTTKRGFREKIKSLIEKIKSSFGSTKTDTPKRSIVDWKIEHSPSDSKEAYVSATPIYDEEKERTSAIVIPESTEFGRDSAERIEDCEHTTVTASPTELSEDIEPWSEHRLVFDFSKLRSTGCVDIEKENVHGNKCYKLLYKNGSERILSLTNMKTMGYLIESSPDRDSESRLADVGSSVPWHEHRIVFDEEKLNATGCVSIEKTVMNGNKCYKLTYRNGAERILNISNLKLMGYARDI